MTIYLVQCTPADGNSYVAAIGKTKKKARKIRKKLLKVEKTDKISIGKVKSGWKMREFWKKVE